MAKSASVARLGDTSDVVYVGDAAAATITHRATTGAGYGVGLNQHMHAVQESERVADEKEGERRRKRTEDGL